MKSKILIADDTENARLIIDQALEKSDAIVESIGNGEAAFNLLDEFEADLILVKSDIPGLSGSQLSEKIKRSQKYYSAKVILLISESEDFTDKQYLESMADDLVFKPFKSSEIYKKIKKALGNRLEEALDDVEMDWEEEGAQIGNKEQENINDSIDDLDAEGNLALDHDQNAKSIEQTYQASNISDKDYYEVDRNEYEEDAYEDGSEIETPLTEAMVDMALIVNPPEVPSEDMELTYFLASGDATSKVTAMAGRTGANKISADMKRDSYFNIYVESIKGTREIKKMFERVLFLDSSMKKREITDLTESVTNSIQGITYVVTHDTVQSIIKSEIRP